MKKVLIIEDDANISEMLRELLTARGYLAAQAFSGTEALLRLADVDFDIALLDLMLPGKTGLQVLTEMRAAGDSTPVIALTAVSDKDSIVSLLEAGANDYITKPFDNGELLARINARLRDGGAAGPKTLRYKDITLDAERFDAYVGDTAVGLSKREFEILRLLMENPNKVFTKNNLYESVWQNEYLGDDNTINVHISKIRAKIAKHRPGAEYIQTVWGIGFKMS